MACTEMLQHLSGNLCSCHVDVFGFFSFFCTETATYRHHLVTLQKKQQFLLGCLRVHTPHLSCLGSGMQQTQHAQLLQALPGGVSIVDSDSMLQKVLKTLHNNYHLPVEKLLTQ